MNEKEFEHIAPQLRRRAIAAARSCGLDSDEAEDVAQDVLLKLWSLREDTASNVAAGPQRTTSGRMAAFAYVAARNLSLDCMRKRHTVPITDSPVIDERNAQPDVVPENAENERWFESKCRSLPSTEYRVLNLRQVERRSDEEIAAILGIGVASVPTLLSRARRKLLEAVRKRGLG